MDFGFPHLQIEGYTVTSPATSGYNCIAWAAGKNDAWWWPDKMHVHYWPDEVERVVSMTAFQALFEFLGYARCDDGIFEIGFEKVALYAMDGKPKHAARQTSTGQWTS